MLAKGHIQGKLLLPNSYYYFFKQDKRLRYTTIVGNKNIFRQDSSPQQFVIQIKKSDKLDQNLFREIGPSDILSHLLSEVKIYVD